MRTLLRLEELAQFLICLFALILHDVPWWAYLLLVIGPDIGMLGYLVHARVGAFTYNLLHHKAFALLILGAGAYWNFLHILAPDSTSQGVLLAGIVLYGHASLDRIFGYGLKFGDSFHHTHLGWIGKVNAEGGREGAGE